MSSSGRKSIGIGIRKRLLGEIDLWSLDLNELPRCTQSKKRTQVIRIGISKVPGTDQTETKITFGKAQHAAEVVGGIVNVACRSVGRDYEQGNAKSIHIGFTPAGCRNRRRQNMVIPAAPIVPRNKDRSVLPDRKSTRLNSSHLVISYAVFCLKKKNKQKLKDKQRLVRAQDDQLP